jgi:hypothetical protein
MNVDDVIVRGTKADSEWFWSMMTAKCALKSWNHVAVGQPATYCGLHITMRRDGTDTICCIDQNADVAAFLADHIQNGIRPLKAPMPNKQAIYEDDNEVSQIQAKFMVSLSAHVDFVVRMPNKIRPITHSQQACTENAQTVCQCMHRTETCTCVHGLQA